MKRFAHYALTILFVVAAVPIGSLAATPTDDQAVLAADHNFIQALGSSNTAAIAKLLDPQFTWITSDGVIQYRQGVLNNLPKSALAAQNDAPTTEHVYGQVGIVLLASGQAHILRVWVKRNAGWRLLHVNEITQTLTSVPVGGGVVPSEAGVVTDCINPCKTVPVRPSTPGAQAALASWQQMETGSAARDMDEWGYHVASECAIVDSGGVGTMSKAERIARTIDQKEAGVRTNEAPPLVNAQMFDFGDTVMMIAAQQPYKGKPFWATRLWTKRDGRYQMIVSFHTNIADVPAFTLDKQLPRMTSEK